jgi:hypothetical protein
MKYIFYSIVTIGLYMIIIVLFFPNEEVERDVACKGLYTNYTQELAKGTAHEIPFKEIDEMCKL